MDNVQLTISLRKPVYDALVKMRDSAHTQPSNLQSGLFSPAWSEMGTDWGKLSYCICCTANAARKNLRVWQSVESSSARQVS